MGMSGCNKGTCSSGKGLPCRVDDKLQEKSQICMEENDNIYKRTFIIHVVDFFIVFIIKLCYIV